MQNIIIALERSSSRLEKSIVFLGLIISSESIRVDNSKTDAITKMYVPQFLTEIQILLRMVNYLGKFIPTFAEVTTPFQALAVGCCFQFAKTPVRRY